MKNSSRLYYIFAIGAVLATSTAAVAQLTSEGPASPAQDQASAPAASAPQGLVVQAPSTTPTPEQAVANPSAPFDPPGVSEAPAPSTSVSSAANAPTMGASSPGLAEASQAPIQPASATPEHGASPAQAQSAQAQAPAPVTIDPMVTAQSPVPAQSPAERQEGKPILVIRVYSDISGESAPRWLLLGVCVVAILTVSYILVRILIALFSPRRQPSPVPLSAGPAPMPARCKEWDQELQEAFALSFETNGFDDAACQAVAAARWEELLASHESIEAKEAERVLRTKVRENEREKIATYASSRCDLDKSEVIETLRGAEEWPHRVLQEARELVAEGSQND